LSDQNTLKDLAGRKKKKREKKNKTKEKQRTTQSRTARFPINNNSKFAPCQVLEILNANACTLFHPGWTKNLW
jgi:hypothetical protein